MANMAEQSKHQRPLPKNMYHHEDVQLLSPNNDINGLQALHLSFSSLGESYIILEGEAGLPKVDCFKRHSKLLTTLLISEWEHDTSWDLQDLKESCFTCRNPEQIGLQLMCPLADDCNALDLGTQVYIHKLFVSETHSTHYVCSNPTSYMRRGLISSLRGISWTSVLTSGERLKR